MFAIMLIFTSVFALLPGGASAPGTLKPGPDGGTEDTLNQRKTQDMELATFGAGCFWCVEAVFENVRGVESVVSGYSGGKRPNPTYEQVSTGASGHAEACQLTFDPAKVTYAELLEIFWKTHDPTTEDRQGNDVGPQYRSAIFYHNEEQRKLAEHYKQKLGESRVYDAPIVTEIVKYESFYPAEKHHQDYYANNPDQPYCRFVIQPKVEKFRKVFGDKLRLK